MCQEVFHCFWCIFREEHYADIASCGVDYSNLTVFCRIVKLRQTAFIRKSNLLCVLGRSFFPGSAFGFCAFCICVFFGCLLRCLFCCFFCRLLCFALFVLIAACQDTDTHHCCQQQCQHLFGRFTIHCLISPLNFGFFVIVPKNAWKIKQKISPDLCLIS